MSGAPSDDDADTTEPGKGDGGAREAGVEDETDEDPAAHLDVDDGCGCAEVWEHLSERRAEGE